MANLLPLEFRPDALFTTILQNGASRVTLVSMEKGKTIAQHQAPIPVAVHLLTGEVDFTAGGQEYRLTPGSVLLLEPRELHAITAVQESTMMVTRLAGPDADREQPASDAQPHPVKFPPRADMTGLSAPELVGLISDHSRLWDALQAVNDAFDRERYAHMLGLIGAELDHHFVHEETILFPRVARLLGGADVGPIAMLLREHQRLRDLYAPCTNLLQSPLTDAQERSRFFALVRNLVTVLWQHIEKEDKFIFPMASRILPKDELHAIAAELAAAE